MAEHTPTPWYINVAAGPTQIAAVEPFHDIGCCFVPSGEGSKDNSGRANAAFIVKAVNNHEEALEIIESLLGLELGSSERALAFLDRVGSSREGS